MCRSRGCIIKAAREARVNVEADVVVEARTARVGIIVAVRTVTGHAEVVAVHAVRVGVMFATGNVALVLS